MGESAAGSTVQRWPSSLAEIWGAAQGHSRSRGAWKIRKIARELFSDDAPGHGRPWALSPAQVAAIRERAVRD